MMCLPRRNHTSTFINVDQALANCKLAPHFIEPCMQI
uniref:Uncharacterized protein n=1 Tax=Setaria italica TaxID=4555 RepID=K3XTN1_SETIT